MALTASGTIAAQNTTTTPFVSRGGPMVIHVRGTFGGGTVFLQAQIDGTNWAAANFPNSSTAALSATAETIRIITDLPAGLRLRLFIGAATNPSVTWSVMQSRDI